MTINTIFWDNDGVLVDTEKYYYESTRKVLAELGVELSESYYREVLLKKSHGPWGLAREKGYTDKDIQTFMNKRNERYSAYLREKNHAIDGAEDVLKMLYGKISMAIVTSSRPEHFSIIHERTGFLKYVDFSLTNDQYEKSKPDPEPYLLALSKSGKNKEEVLVIEDSLRGLESAKEAELKCWVIPNHLTEKQDFSKADLVLQSLKEVPDLLNVTKNT